MEEFKDKFDIDNLFITKVGSWIISLRPKQITLGSLVLSLERECPSLSKITSTEGQELAQAFQEIEYIYDSTFKPDKLNYLGLMMEDNQVHFHVVPRYESFRKFENLKYEDKDWPKPPDVLQTMELDKDLLNKIREKMIINNGK